MVADKLKSIALIGQPNCGKSTFFNSVAGYKAISGNFPGVTVKYQKSKVRILGEIYNIIDLPGSYSLTAKDLSERETRRYLMDGKVDLIINIVDASVLGRSLELTMELLELKLPMVLAVNMIDVVERKGEILDLEKLSAILNIPVYPIVASKGKGVKDLLYGSIKCLNENDLCKGIQPKYNKPLELAASEIEKILTKTDVNDNVPKRFYSLKLLEEDEEISKLVYGLSHPIRDNFYEIKEKLEDELGDSSFDIINKERHGLSLSIYEKILTFSEEKISLDDRLDRFLMSPVFGYILAFLVFYGFFYLIFDLGAPVENFLITYLDSANIVIKEYMGNSLGGQILIGLIQGLGGGIAIVVPYLLPFLIGLAFLEDSGYMSRIAFLADIFMHRIGLHGKSVFPFIMGYGCSVPAVMSTRNLNSTRERLVTSILVTMIPCSARTTVIFALVGYFVGPFAAISLYVINLLVIGVVGKILLLYYPELTPGMILEIPNYNLPTLKNMWLKTWIRLKDFIYVALPVMMLSSGILSILEFYNLSSVINTLLSPVTIWVLGLPKEVGTTLIFGVFRKELTLVMLYQALGTTLKGLNSVMTYPQMFVFSVFVMFYVPCIATLSALWKEIGRKGVVITVLVTTVVALLVSVLVRLFFIIFPSIV